MTNYNFKIKDMIFSVSGSSKSLDVKITGDHYPEPNSTSGSLNSGDVDFNMSAGSGGTSTSSTFTFSGTGFTTGDFSFSNIPSPSANGPMSGIAKNTDGSNFGLESCSLSADGSGGGKKNMGMKARKLPPISSQNYIVNSFSITQVTIGGTLTSAAVMEVETTTGANDLKATCEDLVDFGTLGGPLPLVIKNASDNDSLEVIGEVYLNY